MDNLIAGGNNVVLVGGSGAENYTVNSSSDSIIFGTGTASLNSVNAAFGYSLDAHANTLNETGNFAVASGNSANDYISSSGLGDTLLAGSGNDTLADLGSESADNGRRHGQ